jgi:hypothetical protein
MKHFLTTLTLLLFWNTTISQTVSNRDIRAKPTAFFFDSEKNQPTTHPKTNIHFWEISGLGIGAGSINNSYFFRYIMLRYHNNYLSIGAVECEWGGGERSNYFALIDWLDIGVGHPFRVGEKWMWKMSITGALRTEYGRKKIGYTSSSAEFEYSFDVFYFAPGIRVDFLWANESKKPLLAPTLRLFVKVDFQSRFAVGVNVSNFLHGWD